MMSSRTKSLRRRVLRQPHKQHHKVLGVMMTMMILRAMRKRWMMTRRMTVPTSHLSRNSRETEKARASGKIRARASKGKAKEKTRDSKEARVSKERARTRVRRDGEQLPH